MQLAKRHRSAGPAPSWGPLALVGTFCLAGCVATANIAGADPSPFELTSPRVPDAPVAADLSDRRLSDLEDLSARLSVRARWMRRTYEREIEPLLAILTRPGFDAEASESLKVRIALALLRESRATGISAELLASLVAVENPWLDLDRRSPVGAVGLMQVMPFHAGEWGCPSADLEDLEANICHGTRVFARDLRRSRGNVRRALLRYNGCVRGSNTPDCWSYPAKVWAQAEAPAL